MTPSASAVAAGTHVPAAPPPIEDPLERVRIWAIYEKWDDVDDRAAVLGERRGIEHRAPDGVGWIQEFAKGAICWHPRLGAFEIHGRIYEAWCALGGTAFGYPMTDETACDHGRGRVSRFRAMHLADTQDASICWTSTEGARAVVGVVRERPLPGRPGPDPT